VEEHSSGAIEERKFDLVEQRWDYEVKHEVAKGDYGAVAFVWHLVARQLAGWGHSESASQTDKNACLKFIASRVFSDEDLEYNELLSYFTCTQRQNLVRYCRNKGIDIPEKPSREFKDYYAIAADLGREWFAYPIEQRKLVYAPIGFLYAVATEEAVKRFENDVDIVAHTRRHMQGICRAILAGQQYHVQEFLKKLSLEQQDYLMAYASACAGQPKDMSTPEAIGARIYAYARWRRKRFWMGWGIVLALTLAIAAIAPADDARLIIAVAVVVIGGLVLRAKG